LPNRALRGVPLYLWIDDRYASPCAAHERRQGISGLQLRRKLGVQSRDSLDFVGQFHHRKTVGQRLRRGENERAVALAEIIADFDPQDGEARNIYVESIARVAETRSSFIARNLLRGTADRLLRS
jgi:hypothetical protein